MEEKMKVLNLLEDGKITPQEAIDLLEALNLPKDNYKDKEKNNCRSTDFEDKLRDFGKNVELFTKDIGDRLNDTAKAVEPKIKNAAKAILEKTAVLIDEMSKSLQENEGDNNCCCSGNDGSCNGNDNAEEKKETLEDVDESDVDTSDDNTPDDNTPIPN